MHLSQHSNNQIFGKILPVFDRESNMLDIFEG